MQTIKNIFIISILIFGLYAIFYPLYESTTLARKKCKNHCMSINANDFSWVPERTEKKNPGAPINNFSSNRYIVIEKEKCTCYTTEGKISVDPEMYNIEWYELYE